MMHDENLNKFLVAQPTYQNNIILLENFRSIIKTSIHTA